jgi:hypothetical protein
MIFATAIWRPQLPQTDTTLKDTTTLDPRLSEFASVEEETAYATWLLQQVESRLSDGRPGRPHDEVMQRVAQRLKMQRQKRNA